MTYVKDIYDFLNEIYPFEKAEKWDNSGLLAGGFDMPADCVMTCLDITKKTADEAREKGAGLIVSHHPVIFDPIKSVRSDSVVYSLAANKISAVCCHTNADISPLGTNGAAYGLLKAPLGLGETEALEKLFPDGSGLGWICSCAEISPSELAEKLGKLFQCTVRYTDGGRTLNKAAFCSGSGGSLIDLITDKSTAFITGDVKHNIFIDAENRGLSVFDCTHYATEIPFARRTAELISERFPDIKAIVSERGAGFIHEKAML